MRRLLIILLASTICSSAWAVDTCKNARTGTGYETIQLALDAASAGDSIYVYPGTLTGTGNGHSITWPNTANITLCATPDTGSSLNTILDAQQVSRHIVVPTTVSLSITELSLVSGQVQITDGPDSLDSGGSIARAAGGVSNLTSCRFLDSRAYLGGVFYAGTNTLTNCTIVSNSATFAGGVFTNGTNTLTNCTIVSNSATVAGGMAYNGSYALTSCTVSGNAAPDGGAFEGGTITAVSSNFYFNGGSSCSAGGVASWISSFIATGCVFESNTALSGGYGGVMSRPSGTMVVTLANCTISANSATNGGAFSKATSTLTNCTIISNTATNGGVFYEGTNTLTSCTIASNNASAQGGVFWAALNTLTSCTIASNKSGYAGGVFIYSLNTLTNCTIASNSATIGGVFQQGTSTLNSCIIAGNSATDGGGFWRSTSVLNSCTIASNSATNGGAFYRGDSLLRNCTLAKNTPTIYHDDSSSGGADGELTAYNTIFAGNFNGGTDAYFSTCTISYCVFTDTSLPTVMVASDNRITSQDGQFVDYTGGDYRLAPGSIAVDAGYSPLSSGSTDLAGAARIQGCMVDIGAYESSYRRHPLRPSLREKYDNKMHRRGGGGR